MKWRGRRQSSNIDDRRGMRGGGGRGSGMNPVMLFYLVRMLFSKKGLIILGILAVVMYFAGINPLSLIGLDGDPSTNLSSQPYEASP